MFFAPPKVKSLSKYAEFGVYFGQKHFFVMLGIAFALHALIITVYMLMPRDEVIRIPVRVMNIKLTDGGEGGSAGPTSVAATPDENAPSAEQLGIAVRPVMPVVPQQQVIQHKSIAKAAVSTKPVVYSGAVAAHSASQSDPNLATPKQYVRQSDVAVEGNGYGFGTGKHTPQQDEELIQRYEQTISLWIANHKQYPEYAKRQNIEGDAIVRIRIDRTGHIIFNSIERTSGNSIIDEAVTQMVQASNPVPAVPDEYPAGSQLEFLIPVSFRLQ